MAPVGKAILAAAKLLSNPVGAVASVFRKKKALKKGPTASSAGLVRRHYKGRSGRTGSKVVNDGQGNARYVKSIGRPHRPLNRALQSKIRDMLNPMNHHVIQQTGVVSQGVGKAAYHRFEMMNAGDIDQVIAAATTGGAQNKLNGKLHISNATLSVQIRNQTTNLLTLRVYEYICRRDVPDKIETTPTSATEVDGATDTILDYGWNYQQTAQIDENTVGGTLFQNPMFCAYYKILKVRTIQIGASKVFNLTMTNNKSRVINPLVYYSTDGDVLAGLTRGFVVQAVASMVGPDVKTGSPSTGIINYDFLSARKYAYNQPWSGVAKNTIYNGVPQELSNAQYLNEFSGLPQAQQEA